jgi:hypothetical protein
MNLLAQYNYKVNKPLVPPLVHDDFTRIVIIFTGLILTSFALYKIMKYYNGL